MDEQLFQSLLLYRITMAMFKSMFRKGLISVDEYTEIDTIIAEKYRFNSSTIYR